MMDYAEYARSQREACAPAECSRGPSCWVASGNKESLVRGRISPNCVECRGKPRTEFWKPPAIPRSQGQIRGG